jgi:hypothetical protein
MLDKSGKGAHFRFRSLTGSASCSDALGGRASTVGLVLVGASSYISQESPYSTQHGVKGAEYKDVIVVLDDDEGRHNQFSYDKFFGLKPLSPGDATHLARTRGLLYVCASRAT